MMNLKYIDDLAAGRRKWRLTALAFAAVSFIQWAARW